MDYKEFGEDGCIAAHVVEQKGSADQWAVQRIFDDIRMFGHTDIIMKSDGEPALVKEQREIVDKSSVGSVPQKPPAYDPQANGAVERGVQLFMNQLRAMNIGQEQRIHMKIDTSWKSVEWMVELAPTLINRCLVGHDGKTPYARLMGKNSSKDIVEIGEKVLAKISRGRQRQNKQELHTRWKEAVWVSIAKMSNEHTVILEDGGNAVRCRTIKRRPKDARWDGKTISGIVATPRKPNTSEPDKKEIGTGVTMKFENPEPLTKPEARAEEEVVRRNFRITNSILENMATRQVARRRSPSGPEAGKNIQMFAVKRIEIKMLEDPDEKGWIEKRDKRKPPGKATSSTSAAPEVSRTTGRGQKEEETHEDEHDVLHGPEAG